MTNDIAVRVHKDSVVQDSIYGRRVRGLDVFLTVIMCLYGNGNKRGTG